MSTLDAQPQAADRPVYTNSYKSIVLTLLVTAYTFNFIDRTIISTIGQAIKVDLKITDTQLGLLGGVAFTVTYMFAGFPAARDGLVASSALAPPSSCGWIFSRRGEGDVGALRAAFFASHCSIVRRISRACEPAYIPTTPSSAM